MDDNISLFDNVSKQADALAQALKDNQADIVRLQSVYDDLEEQWRKEKYEFDEVVLHGNSLVSQLCTLEEERNRRQRNVTSLKKEIERTTIEYDSTRRIVVDKIIQYENMKRHFSEYSIKMKNHSDRVTSVERNTPLQKQLTEIKDEIEVLKINYSDLQKQQLRMLPVVAGHKTTKTQLMTEGRELDQKIREMGTTLEDKKRELETVQEKKKRAEMTNFILTKRNAAMLIRMKKNVDKQMEKHSSLVSQRDYLLKMIEKTKLKLQGFTACE